MNQTLFDAILSLSREVNLTRYGTATTTETAKTQLTDAQLDPGIANMRGGTIFITSGANAGSSRKITGHTARNVLTWATNLTAVITSGDAYAASQMDIPRDVLIASVGEALRRIPKVDTDETLVVVSGQDNYTLPTSPAPIDKIIRVEVATSSAVPYGYQEHRWWSEQAGKLLFTHYVPSSAGMKIKLTFLKKHTELILDTDVIPFGVDANELLWKSVLVAAKYGKRIYGDDSKHNWAEIAGEAQTMLLRYEQPQPQTSPKLAAW